MVLRETERLACVIPDSRLQFLSLIPRSQKRTGTSPSTIANSTFSPRPGWLGSWSWSVRGRRIPDSKLTVPLPDFRQTRVHTPRHQTEVPSGCVHSHIPWIYLMDRGKLTDSQIPCYRPTFQIPGFSMESGKLTVRGRIPKFRIIGPLSRLQAFLWNLGN